MVEPASLTVDIGVQAAAPLGALCALLWYRGESKRKASMFGVGWLVSYYSAETIAAWASLSVGFVAFLLGLFGIAIIDKVFNAWGELDIGSILSRFLHKILGLAEREGRGGFTGPPLPHRQSESYPDFPDISGLPKPPRSSSTEDQ